MQNVKTKAMAILIAVILTVSIGGSLALIPSAKAAGVQATFAWAAATPNPDGVGQQMLIYGWINVAMPGEVITNTIRFANYAFVITQPDGTTVTQNFPYVSNPTSSQYFTFTPTQVGTYTVNFTFPGQTYNFPTSAGGVAADEGLYYEPSNASCTFVVQQNPVTTIPLIPLPTDYWTRPINDQNVNWIAIGSNWLGGQAVANFWQENGAAPTSAHVMWTRPIQYGGLEGGTLTQEGNTADPADNYATYYTGMSYNIRNPNPLIVQGVLYYQEPTGEAGSGGPEVALNLQTGQVLWTSTTLYPSFAQIYDLQDPDQFGAPGAILWMTSGTTWMGYDAFTQQFLFNLTNVPSGTEVYLNNGEIDKYVFSYSDKTQTGTLALWNETAAIAGYTLLYNLPAEFPTGPNLSLPANVGYAYEYNTTITSDLLGPMTGSITPSVVGVIPGQYLLGTSSSIALASQPNPNTNPWTMWCLSVAPNTFGTLLWIQSYAAPPNNETEMLSTQPIDPVTNEWTMTILETGQRLAFSIVTGDLVWGPSAQAQVGFQYYSSREGTTAYGNYYVSGYGGIVYCYSMLNGTLLWTFGNGVGTNSTTMGANGPWGNYPIHLTAFADGMVFTYAGEHSPNIPLYKGNMMRVLNANTGALVWELLDWGSSGLGTAMQPIAIADGYAAFFNCYDGQYYCVGQGPSATTVSAPTVASTYGTPVVVKGTVMDISAGTKENQQAANFPNGVPCASDASMTAWMGYVYQQEPMPTNFTGVPVTITILDPNGNYYVVGNATTDATGSYDVTFTPSVPGTYTVVATFCGTNSYYGSSAETYFNVMQAPAPTSAAPTATPTSVADLYFVPAVAAIIVVIIIVGIVLALLMLRKHP